MTDQATTSSQSLHEIVAQMRDGRRPGVERWLTAVIAHAAQYEPEMLDHLLTLKFHLARRLHYISRNTEVAQ